LRLKFNLRWDFNVIWRPDPLAKIFRCFAGQISSSVRAVSSPGGAGRGRHERGMGCGGRDSVGARVCSQGGFRERATGAQDERRCFRLRQDFAGRVPTRRSLMAKTCRVRQNRVVLRPQGWRQVLWRRIRPTGLRCATICKATAATEPGRRGEHGISRKAIAQGMPECFR
jgi:hypothetical protein